MSLCVPFNAAKYRKATSRVHVSHLPSSPALNSQVSPEYFDLLEEPAEEEEDMLDEATCLEATSRLGCQIILAKELDGMVIKLPAYARNFYVDGHVPEPH